jgi:hypothetical protein
VAEHTSPPTEVGTFLIRLGNADRKELERASSAVRSDQRAWEAAGERVAQIVASMGLDEQKAQLFQQATVIVHGKAAQIQLEDRRFALWAAQGVIVGLLAGGSAERTDLRLLCKPFAQFASGNADSSAWGEHLLRDAPTSAPHIWLLSCVPPR